MKRLLFIGPLSGTSRQRQLAFGRSGYEVDVIDPRKKLPPTILFDAIEWHLTPALLSWRVFHSIEKQLLGTERNFYDIAFVDGGSLINAKTVDLLKKYSKSVVAFNHDDPFGPRDWIRFGVFRKAVYHYDLE